MILMLHQETEPDDHKRCPVATFLAKSGVLPVHPALWVALPLV